MKTHHLFRRGIAALLSLALVFPAVAQTPPKSFVGGIAPGGSATAATVTMQDGAGPVPLGVLNSTTHVFTPAGLLAEAALARANEAQALQIPNALSELVTAGSQAVARANLGLGSLAVLSSLSSLDGSLLNIIGSGSGNGSALTTANLPHVATDAALQSYAGAFAVVQRDGFYSPGDGGSAIYVYSGTACAALDHGAQETAITGGCWIAVLPGSLVAQVWGARGDGVSDDYPAISAAMAAAQRLGGRTVYLPATGHAYLVSHGWTEGNGVVTKGDPSWLFAGTTATLAQWAAAGTWVQSTDASNPTITAAGHGSGIQDVHFIRAQPVPSSTAGTPYTPTAYPCEIAVPANFANVDNVGGIGVTCGIDNSYTASSGGGTFTHFDHIDFDAFAFGFRGVNVNDTEHLDDLHFRSMFYAGNPNVVAYREANTYGLIAAYMDNPFIPSIECFQMKSCVHSKDGTVLGNTHGLFNAQIGALDCNLVASCMTVASATDTMTATIAQVIAQGDTGTGQASPLFALASDKVNLDIGVLRVGDAGGSLASLGNGSGGQLGVGLLDVVRYSSYAAGQPGFALGAGSTLTIGAVKSFPKVSGAGARYAGGGYLNVHVPGFVWAPYATFGQATYSCTGAQQSATTDNGTSTAGRGFLQARISGQVNITTAGGSGATFGLTLSGYPEVAASVPATAAGYQSFDTGWVDLTSTPGALGRVFNTCPSGVGAASASLTIEFR